ncbi:hypothetical protein ACLSZW_09610 [Avibacterium avium]|uniref:hypothetical protein n=1 Tax=Avibacterium avium TaxID=751 RepID=UPI003BF91510
MQNQIEIYQSQDGSTQVEVQFNQDTVWLSLQQMADIFGRDKSVISRHLRNIFKEGELDPISTVAKNATVQKEGNRLPEQKELMIKLIEHFILLK